jgi:demethylmenaquinone methyltransferase/2-methoxy-6-polyprenyl-1,4-benzoquinol methylase
VDVYERQKRYYDLRAGEYDATAWDVISDLEADEVAGLVKALSALPPAWTLDVACGTGFLSRHLPGRLTLLDASTSMLEQAASRVPEAEVVHADAMPLPFQDRAFERVFSSHFYDHLQPPERLEFLFEARRVGDELVLVQELAEEHREGSTRRDLRDGSRHEIYKAHFTPRSLLEELGGGETLYCGSLFVAVRRQWQSALSAGA